MKTSYIFQTMVMLFCALSAIAQQGINYKAIINDANGDALANTTGTIQFTILENGTTNVYQETHNPTTDVNGIIIVNIGEGTLISGDFNAIIWGSDPHFLKTEIDVGDGLTDMGTTEFKTVPYALYAHRAESRLPVYTSAEIEGLFPVVGDAVFNNTEKLYQVYDGTSWLVFNSNCWPKPTSADAGSDQHLNTGASSTTLEANVPEVGHGTGEWTIVSGEGGSISNMNNPIATLTGLLSEVYRLRWKISTSCGVSTDEVTIIFEQDGANNYVMDIDGNVYRTVLIGEQLWMAENLKVNKFNNGTLIPKVADIETNWIDITTPVYCWYENDSATYSEYGALYNTFTVMNGDMNVCPTGWHVPSGADWTELEIFLQNNDYNYDGTIDTDQDRTTNNKIAKALASKTNWLDSDQEGVPGNTDYETYRDKSGFSALPSGRRISFYGGHGSQIFIDSGSAAYFLFGDIGLRFTIGYESISSIYFECAPGPFEGSSIRCVKD